MESSKSFETDFAEFELLPQIIIMRAFEGVEIGGKQSLQIIRIINEATNGGVGWISDKINRYSVDPLIVPTILKNAPRLKCWSNVVYGRRSADYTMFMEMVTPRDFPRKRFDTLDPAVKWTYATLNVLSEKNLQAQ